MYDFFVFNRENFNSRATLPYKRKSEKFKSQQIQKLKLYFVNASKIIQNQVSI